MVLLGLIGIFILKWNALSSFIFASIIGGETTAAVVVPLSMSMKLSDGTVTFLTMESAMNSIFSVVFFFAFVGIYENGGIGIGSENVLHGPEEFLFPLLRPSAHGRSPL